MWRLASSSRRLVSAKCFARLGARRGGARRPRKAEAVAGPKQEAISEQVGRSISGWWLNISCFCSPHPENMKQPAP